MRLADGKQLWQRTFKATHFTESTSEVAHAASTPVIDQEHVYALLDDGQCVALTHDGTVAWIRSLANDYGKIESLYGLTASLAQDEASVFALIDHDGPSYLVALNKKTGKVAWREQRPIGASLSSPSVLTIDGVPQIVVSAEGAVISYSTINGRPLWTATDLAGNSITTPQLFSGRRILVGACSNQGGDHLFRALSSNLTLEVSWKERKWEVTTAWYADNAMANFASPIADEDVAYWVCKSGRVTALDAKTGEQLFSEELAEPCWATPLAVGDHVYFFGRDGATTVLAQGRTFKTIAVNRLWNQHKHREVSSRDDAKIAVEDDPFFESPVQYSVAAVDGIFLIRSGKAVHCISSGN